VDFPSFLCARCFLALPAGGENPRLFRLRHRPATDRTAKRSISSGEPGFFRTRVRHSPWSGRLALGLQGTRPIGQISLAWAAMRRWGVAKGKQWRLGCFAAASRRNLARYRILRPKAWESLNGQKSRSLALKGNRTHAPRRVNSEPPLGKAGL
jgi:hypothetical protein